MHQKNKKIKDNENYKYYVRIKRNCYETQD